MTVAIAAPAVSIFNVKMKIGSNKTLIIPPKVKAIIALQIFPSARKILFRTKDVQITGEPSKMYRA